MSTISTARSALGAGIDPRGPRFAASLTSVVLALVLVTPTPVAVTLLALQTVVFAHRGAARHPAHAVRLAVPDPRPAAARRTAASSRTRGRRASRRRVGLGFALVGLVGFATGLTALALVATGFALAAALLNAVFGFCLGCEIYLLLQRATAR